ncbi:MAG: XdhC family protein [Candidatus Limivicinus sp.]|jgi:xanthine dehydrogenase accessory factor
MRNMFKIMSDKLRSGEDLVLVTVIASSGAAPRGAGARMLVGREGRICGTIGGGAVEYRSEHIAAQVLKDKCSGAHDFSLTRDDVENLGMICGGAVIVFFCYIPAYDKACLEIADKAEELFAKGDDMWLISEISAGGKLGLYSKDSGYIGVDAPEWLGDSLKRTAVRTERDGRDFYTEQINSSGKVYVFGCGHVSQELVPVLSHVGFRCIAMDDRPEFARKELFPTAEDVKLIDFNKISDYITVTEEDYACIMSRGHAYDAVIQAQMLKTPACYIGVIGSAAKKAGVQQKLKEDYGFDDSDFKRITTPIGISIKAETPAEIAISIAGQMIELRAERKAR